MEIAAIITYGRTANSAGLCSQIVNRTGDQRGFIDSRVFSFRRATDCAEIIESSGATAGSDKSVGIGKLNRTAFAPARAFPLYIADLFCPDDRLKAIEGPGPSDDFLFHAADWLKKQSN